MKKYMATLMAGGLLFAQAASHAVVTPIATFSETASAFSTMYTGVDPSLSLTSTLTGAAIPVVFTYQSFVKGVIMGSPALNTPYSGLLTFNTSAFTLGEVSAGQNPADSLTYTISSVGNTGVGIADGKVLLKTTAITDGGVPAGILNAIDNQTAATMQGSDVIPPAPNVVTFSSDVIDVTSLFQESYGLSFVTQNPITYSPQAFAFGRYLDTFDATVTGNFGAIFTAVPEPGVTTLMASMLIGGSVLGLRRRRR